ncbi:zinc finger protein 622-like [Penaeus japonicus]|uniref:zinc finger protein 622-like n=1 Tax=Penaeus japonicus TaxID=27405 RepID=UPI001C70EDF0|nr:zinc finger protein 622-like [Penaeus japonicus]
MATFTCLSCHVAFSDGDGQRDHFRSDWHRYNLMRKMSELPPVSRETYNEKVVQVQGQCAKAAADADSQKPYCKPCKKTFATQMAYDNHVKSNKHVEKTMKYAEVSENQKNISLSAKKKEESEDEDDEDLEIEEVDSDEWEDEEKEPIPLNVCLFCNHDAGSLEKKLKHMTEVHQFFIPDLEYCTDVAGLMTYLGWKLGCGFECLVCKWRARRLPSLTAIRQHIEDTKHSYIELKGNRILEYADFYDYSSSYPDADEASPDDVAEQNIITGDEAELVLPSGAVIGHRSLRRYYKQNLNPHRKQVEKKKHGSTFRSLIAHYRSLGWTGTSGTDAVKKFWDQKYLQKMRSRYDLKLGVRGNKQQQHFRQQNPV